MFLANKLNKGAGPAGAYQISRSLRFNPSDPTYLNRTPSSATNRRTWTWSAWVKRGFGFGDRQNVFGASTSDFNTDTHIELYEANQLRLVDYVSATNMELITTQVFRDSSAWYHFVVAVDTTQATASNRAKIYVNGLQVTSFTTATYPSQNFDTQINNTISHGVGRAGAFNGQYFNGYQTEINFIDGQALTPSSFGETDTQTGVWKPKAYSGSYGTNGFYLNFSDNSNTTSTTLGKDYSGNGNNWTPNGFLVSAGVNNDSLVDSPTSYGTDTGVGGEVRGNYCTLNPLYKAGGGTPAITNGNLDMTAGGTGDSYFAGTTLLTAGKWYYEATITAVGSGGTTILIGACRASDSTTLGNQGCYRSSSEIYNLDGTAQTSGATYAANDVIGVAIDIDNGTVKFYKNNTGQGATNSYTFTAGTALIVRGRSDSANPAATFNFGQRPFAYTAPSGFKALCTQNLPTPTIGATTATQAGKFFNPVLYTGNNSTQSITGVGFQPDFIWIKYRTSSGSSNTLVNSVMGNTKYLFSNTTNSEETVSDAVTSFNSDGFSLGANNTGVLPFVNYGLGAYVAWNWKANGSGSTNTAGSITSTVSANTTSGFSVVTYTGTGSAGATVGHGLGVVPSMIIFKRRNGTTDWQVYHTSLGNANSVYLNLTNASAFSPGMLNQTTPTSTLITLGTSTDTNPSTGTMVAYCFAPIAGYSAFGQYTGNGSTDGAFVYTGFRPAYVMIKRTTSGYDWWILDVARGTINAVKGRLYANASDAESTTYPYLDFLSNGFKLRDADGGLNASGEPYIYMCFASNPFKYSLAR